MNVLSLFDGMSCGQIALERAGIEVEHYFASEINHDAIKVTYLNFPNTFQLGDVRFVRYHNGILSWGDPNYANFTPTIRSMKCNIDLLIGGSPCQGFSQASNKKQGLKDARSKLFWDFVRLKNAIKPKWFLLENVVMDAYSMQVVTEAMGVIPTLICSSRFVPQLRKRWYWTNIPIPRLPIESTDKLQDILTSGWTNRVYSRCIMESESRPNTDKRRLFRRYRKYGFNTIVFEREDMCPLYVRSLNQTELERLQGVPEGYTSYLSRNRAASLLGNGWTVPVIAHIFEGMLSGEEYILRKQIPLFEPDKT